jgi:hypothetical protein
MEGSSYNGFMVRD